MHPNRSDSFRSTVTAEPSNHSTRSRTRSHIKVTWGKKIRVRCIASLEDYSDQEKSNSFYGPDDYQRIRDELAEVCFLMKHGTKESDEVSYRGLELKREGEYRRRKLHRWCVTMAVFEENERQHSDGFYDAEATREIYTVLTKKSILEALERGVKDAENVSQQHGVSPNELSEARDTSMEIDLMNKKLAQLSSGKTSMKRINSKGGGSASNVISIDGGRNLNVLSMVVQ